MRFWARTANWRSDSSVSKLLTMRNRRRGRSAGWIVSASGVVMRLPGSVACTRSSSHRCGGQRGGGIGCLAAGVGHHGEREQAGRLDVFFEEVAMPEFEHQQTPEAASHGLATEQVIIHQLPHAAGLEVAALEGAGFEQDHKHVFEFVAHPVDERERESLLLAIERLARHADALSQFSQNVFLLVAT